jgi:hypothetical protein
MGLLDLLTSAKSTTPVDGEAPAAQSGLMSKLNYGGVPFGVRLMAAAEALRTIENPDIARPSLALLARSKEKSDEAKKLEEERKKKQEKADRLADKLELSNPAVAELIRANPDLVEEYGKSSIADTFESNRYARNRADAVEDRDAGFAHTEKGWGVQAGMQEDRQQHDVGMAYTNAQIEADKLKAKQAYDAEVAKGRMDRAKMIAEGFFMDTGVQIDPANPVLVEPEAAAPGPQPIPTPQPGSIEPTPQQVPGLTAPAAPQPGPMPEEEGDAGTATPAETAAFRSKFMDPDLTDNEASMLKAVMLAKLSEDANAGKEPDVNAALGAATAMYQNLLKMRTERQKADAATSEADTKATDADLKKRIEAATTAEKAVIAAQNRSQTGQNVLNAVEQVKKASDPENADYLPATGFGSWLASFAGDLEVNGVKVAGNARSNYSAVKTIQANLGFDALQAMRDASPTGGALGQVAVQELEMLQSTVANLDPTTANFADNIKRVEELYKRIEQRSADYATDISNLRKFPTEENKAEFDEMYGVDAHLKFMGE